METRANHFWVGVFTLGIVVALFAAFYWFAGPGGNVDRRDLMVRFEGSVTGLSSGSSVLFNGIRVGEVTSLQLNKDNPRYVDALLSVDPQAPIKSDTDISLGYQGLTGVGFVQMRGGSSNKQNIFQAGSESTPSLSGSRSGVDDLLVSARNVMARVEAAAVSLEGFVAENRAPLSRSVKNIAAFSDVLASNEDNVAALLQNSGDAARRISEVSGNVEQFVLTVNEIAKAINPQQLRNTLDNVENLTGNLVGASENFNSLIENTRQAADQLGEFSAGLNIALGNVKAVIDAVDARAVGSLVDNIAVFGERLALVPQDFDNLISDARAALQSTNVFTSALGDSATTVKNLFDDAAGLAQQWRATTKRVDVVLAQIGGSMPVPDHTVIASAQRAAASVARAAERVDQNLIEEARLALASVRGAADVLHSQTGKDISEAARSMRALSERINTDVIDPVIETTTSIRQAVKTLDSDVIEEFSRTAASVRGVAERFETDIAPDMVAAARSVRDAAENLDQGLIDEATEAARSINRVATNVGDRTNELVRAIIRTTRAIENGLRDFNLKGGRELEDLMRDTRDAVRQIGNVARGFETNPAGALLGQGRVRKVKGGTGKTRY